MYHWNDIERKRKMRNNRIASVIEMTTKRNQERFFCEVKHKRVITSWHVAGAKMFAKFPGGNPELERVKKLLQKKGFTFIVQDVIIQVDIFREAK